MIINSDCFVIIGHFHMFVLLSLAVSSWCSSDKSANCISQCDVVFCDLADCYVYVSCCGILQEQYENNVFFHRFSASQ